MDRLSWQWVTLVMLAAVVVAVVCGRVLWRRWQGTWPW